MRVIWEASALLPPRTGVGRYAFELLCALQALEESPEFHLVWRSSRRGLSEEDHSALRGTHLHGGCFLPGPLLMGLWARGRGPRIERLGGEGADLVHGVAALLPPTRVGARVLTIHDLHFLRHPEHGHFLGGRLLVHHLPRRARDATRVIVPSQATADDCVELLGLEPSRLVVISHGGAETLSREPSKEMWGRFSATHGDLMGRFWLTVATLEPRKNIGLLVDAIDRLAPERSIPLVLVGNPGWGTGNLVARIERMVNRGRMIWLHHREPWVLQCLLHRAEALIMPSLAEGFGLPLLEAMAAGCPVLCSDIPVFREVTGGHARLFDPRSADALAEQMLGALEDPEGERARAERARAFIRPFTWERTARRTLDVYREAIDAAR
ncbi:glycosyltransferase family 4 protein [Candidatus Sumerlaeota bacterium]|nr:glycosyltransferase family 4 protein [Candidatus Sumerlaeota bacterium]